MDILAYLVIGLLFLFVGLAAIYTLYLTWACVWLAAVGCVYLWHETFHPGQGLIDGRHARNDFQAERAGSRDRPLHESKQRAQGIHL